MKRLAWVFLLACGGQASSGTTVSTPVAQTCEPFEALRAAAGEPHAAQGGRIPVSAGFQTLRVDGGTPVTGDSVRVYLGPAGSDLYIPNVARRFEMPGEPDHRVGQHFDEVLRSVDRGNAPVAVVVDARLTERQLVHAIRPLVNGRALTLLSFPSAAPARPTPDVSGITQCAEGRRALQAWAEGQGAHALAPLGVCGCDAVDYTRAEAIFQESLAPRFEQAVQFPFRFARSDRSGSVEELATAIAAEGETCEPTPGSDRGAFRPPTDPPAGDHPNQDHDLALHDGEVDACLAEHTARLGPANGQIVLDLVVRPEEDENTVSIRSNISAFVERCIAVRAKRWDIASMGDTTSITKQYVVRESVVREVGLSAELWRPRAGSAVRRASPSDTPTPVPQWDPCRR
ncbi:MAG: hypothetical protein AAGE52_27310 [Myxococcota bacterium]